MMYYVGPMVVTGEQLSGLVEGTTPLTLPFERTTLADCLDFIEGVAGDSNDSLKKLLEMKDKVLENDFLKVAVTQLGLSGTLSVDPAGPQVSLPSWAVHVGPLKRPLQRPAVLEDVGPLLKLPLLSFSPCFLREPLR